MTHSSTSEFIYTGPSWATLSYGPENYDINLASEWGIPCHRINHRGAKNRDIYDYLLDIRLNRKTEYREFQYNDSLDVLKKLPVVYVFCEPLVDIFQGYAAGTRQWDIGKIDEYLLSHDHRCVREKLKREQLEYLNRLGFKIGLIGSHSDVYEKDIVGLSNLSIIYPSWQQWMKDVVGITTPTLNFGAEVANNMITYFDEIEPKEMLVNDVHEQHAVWDMLEKNDYWYSYHPSARSNIEFARFVKPMVEKFLEENK